MGKIPVQQTAGMRQANYGSLPGINASAGRPDVSSGKVNRRIYGQHEKFIPREHSGLTAGQTMQAYGKVANNLQNIGSSAVNFALARNQKVQNYTDDAAFEKAKRNTMTAYNKISYQANDAVKNNLSVDQFDEIASGLEKVGDEIYNDIDKGELSKDASEKIDAYNQDYKAKTQAAIDASRYSLKISRATESYMDVIDSATKDGNEKLILDTYNKIVELGGMSPKDAEKGKSESITLMKMRSFKPELMHKPFQAQDKIFDKNKRGISKHFPEATEAQQEQMEGLVQESIVKHRRVVFNKLRYTADQGLLDTDSEELKNLSVEQQYLLKKTNAHKIKAQENLAAEAKQDAATKESKRNMSYNAILEANRKDRVRANGRMQKLFDKGDLTADIVDDSAVLNPDDKERWIAAIDQNGRKFKQTQEYADAFDAINQMTRDQSSIEMAESQISKLQDKTRMPFGVAPDSVVLELISSFNATFHDVNKKKDVEDGGWLYFDSVEQRSEEEKLAMGKLSNMYLPMIRNDRSPTAAFGLYTKTLMEFRSWLGSSEFKPSKVDERLDELTADHREAYGIRMIEDSNILYESKFKFDTGQELVDTVSKIASVYKLDPDNVNLVRNMLSSGKSVKDVQSEIEASGIAPQ